MTKRSSIPGAFAALLLAAPALAQKPILPDFHADPSAHEWDGRYWIYPSHDVAGSKGWDMVDWHAFSSTDLVRWTDHGVIFSLRDIPWAKKWAWAPDAMKRNGKYYFYVTADDQIGVGVADRPDGPFKDALGKPLIARGESGTRVMDPAVFVDDDGQAYLYFGQNAARVVKLREDMVTRDGPIVEIPLKDFHEGIWMHKRSGIYYLSYCALEGDGELKNKLAYSTSRSPLGPFEYRGVFTDNRSRNVHHSIVDFGGQWYLFYHVQGPSWYERRVTAEYLEHGADGSILPVAMTKEGVRARRPPFVTVPEGDGAPVLTDGIFSPGEWDDALRIALGETVTLHLKEYRGVVFVGVRGQGAAGIGPSELLLAAPGGEIQKLHVSAQLFESVLPAAGAEPPARFGLTTGWYANELRRDMAEAARLEKEGRNPIDIMRATSYPSDGIEFAIRRSKVPGSRWLMRLWASAIVGDKPGMLTYPPNATETSTEGWLELRFE